MKLWDDAKIDELVAANKNGKPRFKTQELETQLAALITEFQSWSREVTALNADCSTGDIKDSATESICKLVSTLRMENDQFKSKMEAAEKVLSLTFPQLVGKNMWNLFTLNIPKLSWG